MKSTFLVLLFLIAAFSVTGLGQAAPAPTPTPAPTPSPKPAPADISGKWNVVADAGGQTIEILIEIKQTGSDFTGTTTSQIGNGTIDTGKVTGKTFTAVLKSEVQGQMAEFKMEGSANGDKISGSFSSPAFGSVPFTAARKK